MALDKEVLNKSVTKDDYLKDGGRSGSVLHFWMPSGAGGLISLPPQPPAWWTQGRDDVLRSTVLYESMWASAIYTSITKIAALMWNLKSDVPLQARRSQQLLLQTNEGQGWVKFISKHLRDYLLTDNGAFIEVVRASSASGSKILGLVHLDSRRCRRTGDPAVPVIYRDRKGGEHYMRDYQVLMMSDMPDPSETYFGVGLCAASRAYRAIYKLAALETYVAEKVSGRRPLAIWLTNNISQPQLDDAIRLAENQATQEGRTSYMGAIVMTNIDPSVTPATAKIDLAGLPDGFVAADERKMAILTYADAIGIDPQELDPALLASKSQGAGSQARTIDDKASSRGLISYRQDLTFLINWNVLPSRVWFYFRERDFRDQKQRVDIDSIIIDNATKMVAGGFMEGIEGRQFLVDQGVLEAEYMPIDITPTTILDSEDKVPPENVSDEERAQFIDAVRQSQIDQQQADMDQQAQAQATAQAQLAPPPGQPPAMPGGGGGGFGQAQKKPQPQVA